VRALTIRTCRQFSTLTSLDHLHGYWFRMECDTVLCIEGTKAEPGTAIALEPNWNLVSYLPDADDAPEIALQSMISGLVVDWALTTAA